MFLGSEVCSIQVTEYMALGLTTWPDYVFVDEHNRHKRLKGKAGVQSLLSLRI